jgi:hypothetical protein
VFSSFDTSQPPDPFRSNLIQLVMRPDVRTEIKTTSRQREQLDDLARRSSQNLRDKALAAAQELRRHYRRPDPSAGVSAEPPTESTADRINAIQQRRQELTKAVSDAEQDIGKQIAQILRPEQLVRALQLDYQYRGPLSFCDPEMANYLQFTSEQNNAMRGIRAGYQAAQTKARQAAMTVIMDSPEKNTNSPRNVATDPTLMLQAQQIYRREEAKAKKDAEHKALAVLSPDQAQAWQTMQGAKFTFRTVF